LCREVSQSSSVEVVLDAGPLSGKMERPMPPDMALCLFRVAQEALQNVVKHSGSSRAQVGLTETEDALELSVSDFGRGFSSEVQKRGPGLGLISMQERARLVHGTVRIETHPNRGTKITVSVPLRQVPAT
jgi:signal transduction histidine kinase